MPTKYQPFEEDSDDKSPSFPPTSAPGMPGGAYHQQEPNVHIQGKFQLTDTHLDTPYCRTVFVSSCSSAASSWSRQGCQLAESQSENQGSCKEWSQSSSTTGACGIDNYLKGACDSVFFINQFDMKVNYTFSTLLVSLYAKGQSHCAYIRLQLKSQGQCPIRWLIEQCQVENTIKLKHLLISFSYDQLSM